MSNPSSHHGSPSEHRSAPCAVDPAAHALAPRAGGGALRQRVFNSFPDLAAWCRPRVPESDRPRFAMGHGDAFVTLVRFMYSHPGADLALVALSEPLSDAGPEQARMVFACVRHADLQMLEMPADAALLYERAA